MEEYWSNPKPNPSTLQCYIHDSVLLNKIRQSAIFVWFWKLDQTGDLSSNCAKSRCYLHGGVAEYGVEVASGSGSRCFTYISRAHKYVDTHTSFQGVRMWAWSLDVLHPWSLFHTHTILWWYFAFCEFWLALRITLLWIDNSTIIFSWQYFEIKEDNVGISDGEINANVQGVLWRNPAHGCIRLDPLFRLFLPHKSFGHRENLNTCGFVLTTVKQFFNCFAVVSMLKLFQSDSFKLFLSIESLNKFRGMLSSKLFMDDALKNRVQKKMAGGWRWAMGYRTIKLPSAFKVPKKLRLAEESDRSCFLFSFGNNSGHNKVWAF